MIQDTASATSETYKLKVQTFANSKPEEFLQNTKDFKTGIYGTVTTSVPGKIQFLRTMLHREAPREFDVITSQIGSTNNTHLKQINEGLLSYPPPPLPNALNKKERAIRRDMRKPRHIQLKIFAAQLAELRNHLPLLLGSINAKKMDPEEINNILIHTVPNSW